MLYLGFCLTCAAHTVSAHQARAAAVMAELRTVVSEQKDRLIAIAVERDDARDRLAEAHTRLSYSSFHKLQVCMPAYIKYGYHMCLSDLAHHYYGDRRNEIASLLSYMLLTPSLLNSPRRCTPRTSTCSCWCYVAPNLTWST